MSALTLIVRGLAVLLSSQRMNLMILLSSAETVISVPSSYFPPFSSGEMVIEPSGSSASFFTNVFTVYTGIVSYSATNDLSPSIVKVIFSSVEYSVPLSTHLLNLYPKFFLAVSVTSLPSFILLLLGTASMVPASAGLTVVVKLNTSPGAEYSVATPSMVMSFRQNVLPEAAEP